MPFRRTALLALALLSVATLCPAQTPAPANGYTLLTTMLGNQATVATDQAKLAADQATLTADQSTAATATTAFVAYLGTAGNAVAVLSSDATYVTVYTTDSTVAAGYRATVINLLSPAPAPTPVTPTPAPAVDPTPTPVTPATQSRPSAVVPPGAKLQTYQPVSPFPLPAKK